MSTPDSPDSRDRSPEFELVRLRQAVATSGEIIFLTDLEGVFTYVNPAFSRTYGWNPEEVVGLKTPRILKNPNNPPGASAALWRVLLSGGVARGDYENRTRDGRPLYVDGSASPIVHDDGKVIGYLAVQRDITARRAADERLRLTQYFVDHTSDAVFWIDAAGHIVYANEQACRALGYTKEHLLHLRVGDVDPSLTPDAWAAHWASIRERGSGKGEAVHKTRDGRMLPVEISATFAVIAGREHYFASARDISDRKALTEQLLHSQKMEAIGVLAGGVAHDFNNLLSVVLSYAGLVLSDLKPSDPMWADVEEIRKAGERAAGVARQLLVFSRREVHKTSVVDLNHVVAELEKLLRRILGEDVRLLTVPAPDLWAVMIDPGQAEQMLVNLAVNARDAMPVGGELVISTSNVGDATVRVEVADTGHGMSPEVAARIFEPFFTTKSKGAGTGLGLSIVYGIVTQFGGDVRVRSEIGQGTTFTIDLPAARGVDLTEARVPAEAPMAGRGQCVLVVEDEDAVRTLVVRILVRSGYRVLEARNAGEALLICERPGEAVDLLLTDVIMPQMSGKELADRLAKVRGNLPVLFMTGYSGRALDDGLGGASARVLAKPFSREELLEAVEAALA